MADERDPVDRTGRHGEAEPCAVKIREAAGKTTEKVGKILLDLQIEAEGKVEPKPEDDP